MATLEAGRGRPAPAAVPSGLAGKGATMVDTRTPICSFGWKAPEFSLPGIDGRTYRLADVRGPKGLLVMFICKNCCIPS